jgi:hypothetical protein
VPAELRARSELVGLEVVAQAEAHGAALGGEALVFRFLERQGADLGEQRLLLFLRQEVLLV